MWSSMMLEGSVAGLLENISTLAPQLQGLALQISPALWPRRTRRYWTTTSWVVIIKAGLPGELGPLSWMPPPGAVCPAMVMKGLATVSVLTSVIVPPVRKTQVRGPLASTQARSDPAPESFTLVTR